VRAVMKEVVEGREMNERLKKVNADKMGEFVFHFFYPELIILFFCSTRNKT
jgi:hypothetical protein